MNYRWRTCFQLLTVAFVMAFMTFTFLMAVLALEKASEVSSPKMVKVSTGEWINLSGVYRAEIVQAGKYRRNERYDRKTLLLYPPFSPVVEIRDEEDIERISLLLDEFSN